MFLKSILKPPDWHTDPKVASSRNQKGNGRIKFQNPMNTDVFIALFATILTLNIINEVMPYAGATIICTNIEYTSW